MRLCLQQEDTPQARRLLQELSRAEQYVEMVMVYLRLTGAAMLSCASMSWMRSSAAPCAGSREFIGRN